MKHYTTILLFAAAQLSASVSIINGDFSLEVPRSGTANGWTAQNNDSAGGWRSTGGNPDGYYRINWFGNDTDPMLSQTITGLTPGAIYEVTGDYSEGIIPKNTGSTNAFGVAIDGTFLFEVPGFGVREWKQFSVTFTAIDTDAVLKLQTERNGTDVDYYVDNIDISVIPEPAAAAGLFGLVMLMAARRKS